MVDMESELLQKREELASLLRLNLTLRARERVLERALDGGQQQLSVLAAQSSAHSEKAAPLRPHAAGSMSAGSPSSSSCATDPEAAGVSGHPATPPDADLPPSGMPGPGPGPEPVKPSLPAGHGAPASPPPSSAAPDFPVDEVWCPGSDTVLERVLCQLRAGLPLEQEVPEELLRSIATRFKTSVDAFKVGGARLWRAPLRTLQLQAEVWHAAFVWTGACSAWPAGWRSRLPRQYNIGVLLDRRSSAPKAG